MGCTSSSIIDNTSFVYYNLGKPKEELNNKLNLDHYNNIILEKQLSIFTKYDINNKNSYLDNIINDSLSYEIFKDNINIYNKLFNQTDIKKIIKKIYKKQLILFQSHENMMIKLNEYYKNNPEKQKIINTYNFIYELNDVSLTLKTKINNDIHYIMNIYPKQLEIIKHYKLILLSYTYEQLMNLQYIPKIGSKIIWYIFPLNPDLSIESKKESLYALYYSTNKFITSEDDINTIFESYNNKKMDISKSAFLVILNFCYDLNLL